MTLSLTVGYSADRISVTLTDGRTVHGQVAEHTDELALWLRSTGRNVILEREYAWATVASVQVDDHEYTRDQFRDIARRFASPRPHVFFPPAETNSPRPDRPSVARRSASPQVLHVEASVANWDGDVETDGLILRLRPSTNGGESVPVHGQILVKLNGRRFQAFRGTHAFVEIGQWSRRVLPENVVDREIEVRLPFQNLHPDFQLSLLPQATLSVHLVTRGTRPLAASIPVQLREFDRLRDDWQTETGSRFFPGETTSRRIPSPASMINN